jgi:glutamate N-acetyltransferase/amino-acid N-acetyltransferase
MTTDTVLQGGDLRRRRLVGGGMAKGAGMLAPALATMLVVITTDAVTPTRRSGRGLRGADRP